MARLAAALPAIGAGLVVILASLVAALVLRRVFRGLAQRAHPDHGDLWDLAGTVALWAVVAFGVVTGLGTMGLNVGALIAGLGLTGFALGFALKDAVSNLLAGVLVLAYRPFRRGDHIVVAGFDGTVMRIDLRYTVLQTEDTRILIPNQQLFTNAITLRLPQPPRRETP
ncbi:mechanosensitive ion channel family protein [Arenibaculum pallidiluteum]|uniref:mechanosensitive ion channel family protein n=1 Tax=Arenibaculum pallidiluteum TaxID=2812559 RepID=UPI001A9754D5|nr:mechanosensitive ion channel domain-containing protein [Arenibaculum pallidiluteum]